MKVKALVAVLVLSVIFAASLSLADTVQPSHGIQSLTLGQVSDLVNKLGGPAVVKDILSGKKTVRVEATTSKSAPDPILTDWSAFYRNEFGLTVDLSSVVIPPHQSGFDRVLVIPRGLTINQVIAAMRKHFSVYLYTNDLDRDVPTNERDPKTGAYAIRVRDRVEADEELKDLSANQVKQMGFATLTLLDRLVYELKYYSETKSHLDIGNITLCSGSRYSDGNVPGVDWHVSRLYVGWCGSVGSRGRVRARSAVR